MKNRVLYFTSMPSPFQLEFISYIDKHSHTSEFIPVFMSGVKDYRKTWGETSDEYIVIQEKNLFQRQEKILNIIKEYEADTVIFTQYSALYTFLTLIFIIRHGKKYFIGPIENMHKRNVLFDWLKKKYFGLIAFRAKAVFAIGTHAAKDYSEHYKGPILNIPYTFDLSNLLNSKKNISDKVTFLYSGRLVPFRNPLLVIECFSEIANEYNNVRLIISGVGELREDCDKLIKQLNLGEKVIWKNNFQDWHDIHRNLYRQADILLALQVHATWGLIIQEAMAAGLGIIATRTIEAANELIVDNYNGFLVDLDKEDVTSKMRKYLDDNNLLKQHSNRSKDIVPVIDIKNVGNRFLEFFEKV